MDCCWMVGMDHGSSVLKEENKKKIYKFKLFKNSKETQFLAEKNNLTLKKYVSKLFSKQKNHKSAKIGHKKGTWYQGLACLCLYN